MLVDTWAPPLLGANPPAVDPVSNLSNYGLAGTVIAIVVIGIGVLWRASIKSTERQYQSWEQQRLDLVARIDQANARADRAEEKRDEANKANQRAVEEMRALADNTSGRGMEVLQRALTAVAESAAREKQREEEIERMHRDNDRLSRELERRRE